MIVGVRGRSVGVAVCGVMQRVLRVCADQVLGNKCTHWGNPAVHAVAAKLVRGGEATSELQEISNRPQS